MDRVSLARWLIVILAILGLLFALVGLAESWNKSKRETNQVRSEKDKLQQNLKQLEKRYQKLKISKKAKPQPPKVATATQPKPQQPAAVYPISCKAYRPIVEKYAWNVDVAMAVMYAESGCNPNAVSPTNDHGLFQLHGIPIYNPAENVAYAYNEKYMKGGWSHWTVCTNGLVSCW